MSSYHRRRKIASNLALIGGELRRNPLLELDEQGTILSVESWERVDSTQGCEFYGGLITAGFVNAHCHLELSHLHGKLPAGGGLALFASSIGGLRTVATERQRQSAILAADIEMQREGIVAVADITNGTSTQHIKSKSQIHYHNFAENFGLQADAKPATWMDATPTPHSTYSLSQGLFRNLCNRGEGLLSIHFMESAEELELFEGRGPFAEWYSRAGFVCDFLHYASPAERLVSNVPPTRSVMLVHGCALRERDIELIMNHFTAPVYWVLCPRSNHYISHLEPPVELLRRAGAKICIGTDSLASNHSLSMIEELKLIKNVPLAERLDWATRRGAEALGLERMGDLRVGARPAINLISGLDYEKMEFTNLTCVKRIL